MKSWQEQLADDCPTEDYQALLDRLDDWERGELDELDREFDEAGYFEKSD